MITFVGDYTVKLDAKGRLTFPSALKRQMKESVEGGFVLKKDIYQKCLILYPMEEWERQMALIRSKTNQYNKKHAEFLRKFFAGTAELHLDASSRILVPKRLLDLIGAGEELTLAGQSEKIEIWPAEVYDSVSEVDDDFAAMAEDILGGSIGEQE